LDGRGGGPRGEGTNVPKNNGIRGSLLPEGEEVKNNQMKDRRAPKRETTNMRISRKKAEVQEGEWGSGIKSVRDKVIPINGAEEVISLKFS